jgi:hypothetical protein
LRRIFKIRPASLLIPPIQILSFAVPVSLRSGRCLSIGPVPSWGDPIPMSESQLRVKLVVAAGVVGASLLGATFVGCQSSPSGPAQSGPYGQYNGNQFGAAPNGQQASAFGGGPQMASAGSANGLPPQGQQAFLNETQRLGTQQNLSAQDVVAMARSGQSEQQITMAIQQRGANLRSTPGVSQYLAQNGVNPAVLGGAPGPMAGQSGSPMAGPTGGPYPGAYSPQVAMNDPQAAFGANANMARQTYNPAMPNGVTSATYPAAQGDAGQLQSATYETLPSSALDQSGAAAINGQANTPWRATPH